MFQSCPIPFILLGEKSLIRLLLHASPSHLLFRDDTARDLFYNFEISKISRQSIGGVQAVKKPDIIKSGRREK